MQRIIVLTNLMINYNMKFLLQCPCSEGKANILLLLAIVAGIWLLAGWIKRVLKKKGDTLMNKIAKIAIVIVLIVAVIIVIVIKRHQSGEDISLATDAGSLGQAAPVGLPAEYKPENLVGKGLPALIDIGAGTCIPCKLMAPILEELEKGLQGKAIVQFIDLNKYPGAAKEYRISVMPTQIFYDVSGKELFRHEGFYSREDILAKWKELGVDLTATGSQLPTFEQLATEKPDERPKEKICYMCDGDINPKTLV